jgi:hypothetical protein
LGDAEKAKPPDIAQEFANAHRQQATTGKHKGKWFISPKRVAILLSVDVTYISALRRNGIPWALNSRGKKIKPTTQPFKNGYYGRTEEFWLEDEVLGSDEVLGFKQLREGLSEKPGDGLTTVADAVDNGDISVTNCRNKRKNGEFGSRAVVVKCNETVKGKRKFFFTVRQRALVDDDHTAYRNSRTVSPVPPDRITTRDLAIVFRVDDATVLDWGRRNLPALDGKKLSGIRGLVLTIFTRNGKRATSLRPGKLWDKRQAQRLWKYWHPTRPLPPALELNFQGSPSGVGGDPAMLVPPPADTPPPPPPVNEVAPPPPVVESNGTRGAAVPATSTFVPSAYQRRILKLLEGRALTADKLEAQLTTNRADLFNRGLNELKAHGLIENSRRIGGYFRPDFPPAEFAQFFERASKSQTEAPTV